jgi:hypothetical protein
MANPHTTTITFPLETLQGGNTWQLILTFSTATEAANAAINAEDQNILILDHGKVGWDYDLENRYLCQGQTSITISDTDEYISDNFLFGADDDYGTSNASETDKQFIVEIKLNGATEFYGNCVEDSIFFSEKDKKLVFSASPKLDLLKNTMLYDEDGIKTNPLGYGDLTVLMLLSDIVEDIFQFVSPSATVSLKHDWEFYEPYEGVTHTMDEIKLSLQDLYNNVDKHLNDLSDLLKHLCTSFFARTGFINSNKAIFSKISFYDTADTQTLTVTDTEKETKYAKLTWCKFSPAMSGIVLPENEVGTYTNMAGRYMNEVVIPWCRTVLVAPGTAGYGTIYSVGDVNMAYGRDPRLYPSWSFSAELQANCWHKFRNDLSSQIIYKLKCTGITYEIDKTCIYDHHYYQVLSMEKDWEKNETNIDALRVF